MAARAALKVDLAAPALVAAPRSGLTSPRPGTTTALAPASTAAADTTASLMGRMRAILKRHQCGEEEEAVSLCLRQASAAAGALETSAVGVAGGGAAAPDARAPAGAGCELFIETFRFCRLHTQQHNYPAAPAFLGFV